MKTLILFFALLAFGLFVQMIRLLKHAKRAPKFHNTLTQEQCADCGAKKHEGFVVFGITNQNNEIECLPVCLKCGSQRRGITGAVYQGIDNNWYQL